MSWIDEISFENAEGKLRKLYDQVKGPNDTIDNVLTVHSLRPYTLSGHMMLYKNVLHNSANTLPNWYLEALGVYVSFLNECSYCVDHHLVGMKRQLNDETKAKKFYASVKNDDFSTSLDDKEQVGMSYAWKLTLAHNTISESDIDQLRSAGFDDGQILEINQVVSYFNYANRTVIGLGVNTDGDIIGLSPNDSENPDNWSHH